MSKVTCKKCGAVAKLTGDKEWSVKDAVTELLNKLKKVCTCQCGKIKKY